MYAPSIWEFTRMTHRDTKVSSSSWLSASLVCRGSTKYRQIKGSSLIFGVLRVGIFERFTTSKCSLMNASHTSLACFPW